MEEICVFIDLLVILYINSLTSNWPEKVNNSCNVPEWYIFISNLAEKYIKAQAVRKHPNSYTVKMTPKCKLILPRQL